MRRAGVPEGRVHAGVRAAATVFALAPLLAGAAEPSATRCAGAAELVERCFRLRGRMFFPNGTPSVRIWRVGTKRILGVRAYDCDGPRCPVLPPSIARVANWDVNVFADFQVCPYTQEEPGVMQFVCVEAAKNVTVRRRE